MPRVLGEVFRLHSRTEGAEAVRAARVANALQQRNTDRKTTCLKAIQGRIWRGGYESGTLRSVVFDDGVGARRGWRAAGLPVAISSSGSGRPSILALSSTLTR